MGDKRDVIGTLYLKDGTEFKALMNVTEVEIIQPVKVKHFIRWGMGMDYHERGYYCPKCKKLLAYFNGVIWTKKRGKQKYCSKCGYELNWRVEDEIKI